MNACIAYIEALKPQFVGNIPTYFNITDESVARGMIRPRDRFSHKGDFGNGALIAGSAGMMGAAALCAKAFMRSGGGKLTCHIPEIGYDILQIAVPEAMAKVEPGKDHIASVSSLEKYDVVGVGPGLGSYSGHATMLSDVFKRSPGPMVIDADALNTIGRNHTLLQEVPHGSVLTPHAMEFERIFGKTASDLDRISLALKNASSYGLFIVLKGAFTIVATPAGIAHVNTTGNPGMATGGTGDVLTGIITGLLGQKYSPEHAAVLGVYLHGLAGDLAAASLSQEAMIAGDVVSHLGKAYQFLHR